MFQQVEAMVDCLRLEWSPIIAQTIISLTDCMNQYKTGSCKQKKIEEDEEVPSNISVNVALSHINLFMIVNQDMCLMTRVDAVTLEKSANKSGAMISGLKVVDMVPYKGQFLIRTINFFNQKQTKKQCIPFTLIYFL